MSARSQNTRPRRLRPYVLVLALLIGGPALALGLPASLRIPILAPPHPTGEPPDAALFSHWQHDTFSCTACHPSTFPQRKVGFTHDDMDRGLYCGSCHNGTLAFSPKDRGVECETCHVPTKPPPDIDEDQLW